MMENPVLWKELKARLRSRQTVPVRVAVGGVVLLFVLGCYYFAIVYFGGIGGNGGTETARQWWEVGVWLQSIMIWLLCPALAANAVTQEKEQQTWEMLVFTLLSPAEILVGKLIARLVPMVAILASFLPYMVYCLAYGGAKVSEFLVTYTVFAIWIVFLTTVSLFMSWAFRRTAAAIAMSYLVLFALTIGTGLIEATLTAGQPDLDSPIIWLNPVRILKAMTDPMDPRATQVMLMSHMTYLGAAAFLFWRMVRRFRAFAIE